MILIHDRNNRGQTNTGWLDSRHTFSFGNFQDPSRMGFRALRVINDDRVIPGAGFDMHRHHDMEIITIVLDGALEHKDSLGNGSVIHPGEIQRMSAGSGIAHSEFNPSGDNPVHLLQIWILPKERGLSPSYEQKAIAYIKDGWTLAGGPEERPDAVKIHQDVRLWTTQIEENKKISYDLDPERFAFLHVAKGQIFLNGDLLKEGDAAQVSETARLDLEASTKSEILLFDLA